MVSEIWGGLKFTLVGAADFCPPVKCRGRIGRYGMVVFYSSYGATGWYDIGGAVVGVGRRNGEYIWNFPLLPFWGTHCANGSGSWGTRPSKVWCGGRPIIDTSQPSVKTILWLHMGPRIRSKRPSQSHWLRTWLLAVVCQCRSLNIASSDGSCQLLTTDIVCHVALRSPVV